MDEPIGKAAAFHAAYGFESVDVRKRAQAVSAVTSLAAGCGHHAEVLLGMLWSLLSDLEAAASDEVLLTGCEQVGLALAQMLLELYGAAQLLGITQIEELVEREYVSRMSALSEAGYRPVTVVGLVALPGA